ncbi:M81 family metallopeptidase [Bauldia sp.]|uniref:M81 family metallopeptidase n=1 Tax=Bauldia sp. TaxID=2575872 RepID=UPI003BA8E38C
MTHRIALGGIHTECSTYSPQIMRREDFIVVRGDDLSATVGEPPDGVDIIPLFWASAVPGGPVAADVYQAFKTEFLNELSAAMPLDGVCLLMHGAVHVEGMDDAEADWIGAVREIVGDACPIAVSYDLHGNVSQPIIDAIDIFAAYRTAPHIDVTETYRRAFSMLTACLTGGFRPGVAWAPIPVLLPGERTSTEQDPAKSLYARLPSVGQRPGVRDANLMVGYVWADVPRATAAAVVTGTEAEASLAAAGDLAEAYWSARAAFDFGVETGPVTAMLDAAERATTRPVILADSGDNPTGGGVGDRTDVLAALLDRGFDDVLVAGIADPPATLAAAAAGEGARLDLTFGGALGSACQPITRTVDVVRVLGSAETRDLLAVVRTGPVRVVLTYARRPFHDLADFAAFGEDVTSLQVLLVKSGYLSPELAPIANPALMALSDGAVNQDIVSLSNQRRPTPTFPFQPDFDWQPNPRLSRRFPV